MASRPCFCGDLIGWAGAMLLIRGRPMAGESLSSFRQRIWMRNGHTLFPVYHPELRRTDPDLQRQPAVMDIVSRRVGMAVGDVEALSLWSHPLLPGLAGATDRRMPRWVVLLQYARAGVGSGSVFCPLCLMEGPEPYFRTAWRLSASTACPHHRLQLLDRCPTCALPAWPYAAATASGFFQRQLELDQCPRCRFRLRESVSGAETSANVMACARSVSDGGLPRGLGPDAVPSLREGFDALLGVINLALRRRSRRKVGVQEPFRLAVDALDAEGVGNRSFDRINVIHRRLLIDAAWPLMAEWPHRFLNFASNCGVSAVDFSEDRHGLPSWFLGVVDEELGQPGRMITAADVDSAVEVLESGGLPVHAEAVGRMLGSRYAATVRERFAKRETATSSELAAFADGLLRYIEAGPANRSTSRQVRARDVAAVAATILTAMPVESVLRMGRSEIERLAMREHRISALDLCIKPVLAAAFECADRLWRVRSGGAETEPFFVPHRGISPNLRGPSQALRKAMEGLDDRLPRRPWVFFEAAG